MFIIPFVAEDPTVFPFGKFLTYKSHLDFAHGSLKKLRKSGKLLIIVRCFCSLVNAACIRKNGKASAEWQLRRDFQKLMIIASQRRSLHC
jgi:hypothetical protein